MNFQIICRKARDYSTGADVAARILTVLVICTVMSLALFTGTPAALAQGAPDKDVFLRQQAVKQLAEKVGSTLDKYEGVEKVAVMKFVDDSDSLVQDHFMEALVGTHLFQVIERELLDRIIVEQNLQKADFMDQDTAVKVGKVAGAQAVVFGKVTEIAADKKLQVSAHLRMINVQDGTILWTKNLSGESVRSTFETEAWKTTQKKVKSVFSSYAKPLGIGLVVLIILVLIIKGIRRGEREFDGTPRGGSGDDTEDHLKSLQRTRNTLQEAIANGNKKGLKEVAGAADELDRNLGLVELHVKNNKDRFSEKDLVKIETKVEELQRLAERIRSNIEDSDGAKVVDLAKSAGDLAEDIKQL